MEAVEGGLPVESGLATAASELVASITLCLGLVATETVVVEVISWDMLACCRDEYY